MLGDRLPEVRTLAGEATTRLVETLARTESPALTARRARRAERSGAPHDPIVWREARGANVLDADGNVFVDLTAGFGVAAAGHAHPRIVQALTSQSSLLIHALGDVHPSDVKVALLERLAAEAPFEGARVVLGLNGSDAICAALKTAMLATRRAGVLAFEGGYHGLMYAPLALCGYSEGFRAPFAAQLGPHVRFAPYPSDEPALERALAAIDPTIGAVVIEPVLGRGGVVFAIGLDRIAARCREVGALLVVDEIFTGLGRAGTFWAHRGVTPDLVCAGKALGGGVPLSACLGREEVMAAWGDPSGEAIHTATFAGHPLACATGLAQLDVIERERLVDRSRDEGARWLSDLQEKLRGSEHVREVRGRGLMIGVELDGGARTLRVVRALLERGWITLPAGAKAEVLSLTPPLSIARELLDAFTEVLAEAIAQY